MNQGARDGGSLLFATAELMNEMPGTFRQPDQGNQFGGSSFTLPRRNALQKQWEADVFNHVHRWQKIKELKYQAELLAAVFRQGSIIGRVQCQLIHDDFPGGWLLQPGQEMQ